MKKRWGLSTSGLHGVELRWAEAGFLDRGKIRDARFTSASTSTRLYSEHQQRVTPDDLSRDFLIGYYTAVKDLASLVRKSTEAE